MILAPGWRRRLFDLGKLPVNLPLPARQSAIGRPSQPRRRSVSAIDGRRPRPADPMPEDGWRPFPAGDRL